MDTNENKRRTPATGQRRQPGATPPRKRSSTSSRTPKKQEAPRPLQDVVYLPPKPFQRNRLLLRLATVFAVVLALVLAMSVFFKVENIQVSGIEKYSAWDISQASGIKQGDNLLFFGIPGASAKIMSLPYVKDVRIGIKLPNTVLIEITEVQVTYAIKAHDDAWWLVSSDGRIVDKSPEGEQTSHTKILGVHLLNPQIGSRAVAQETAKPQEDENGNPIPVTVTAAQRLKVALDITENLEMNGIIGQAASIDVNDLGDIQLWYGQQYQVKLGDTSQLSYKISSMKTAIDELNKESHNSGVLDVSFQINQNGVRYTPFQ